MAHGGHGKTRTEGIRDHVATNRVGIERDRDGGRLRWCSGDDNQ